MRPKPFISTIVPSSSFICLIIQICMRKEREREREREREGITRETFRLIQKHVATRIAWQENFPHKKDKSENGKKMRDSEKEYVPILFARPYHARCHNPWIIVSRLSSYIYGIVSSSFNTHLHFFQLKPFCMIFYGIV